jgi:hypothetical protein
VVRGVQQGDALVTVSDELEEDPSVPT